MKKRLSWLLILSLLLCLAPPAWGEAADKPVSDEIAANVRREAAYWLGYDEEWLNQAQVKEVAQYSGNYYFVWPAPEEAQPSVPSSSPTFAFLQDGLRIFIPGPYVSPDVPPPAVDPRQEFPQIMAFIAQHYPQLPAENYFQVTVNPFIDPSDPLLTWDVMYLFDSSEDSPFAGKMVILSWELLTQRISSIQVLSFPAGRTANENPAEPS